LVTEQYRKHGVTPSVAVSPTSGTATIAGIEPALTRIAEMAHIPANWDGAGAVPPTGPAVAEACRLIVALAEREHQTVGRWIVPLTSSPIADGGLQVEWGGPDARIEVQCAPDGSFGYLIVRGTGGAADYEEADDVAFETVVRLVTTVAAP